MSATTESVTEDFSPLFAPPSRWGWEFVQPQPPRLSPEREQPPAIRQVKFVTNRAAAGATKIAAIATGAAVGVIYLDASFGLFTSASNPASYNVVGVQVVHLAAAGAFFWIARLWLSRRKPLRQTPVWVWVVAGAGAVVVYLVPYLVLPLAALAAWIRFAMLGGGTMVPDPEDQAKAQAEYQQAVAAWQQRVVQFEESEQRRASTVDIWYPVLPSSSAQTICVFGGTQISWAAGLTTLGTSMLGTNSRLLLVDLSRWRSTEVLRGVALRHGVNVTLNVLPADSGVCGLLSNFDWSDLTSVLVELLYTTETDAHASFQGRQDDRAIIREVAGCLDKSKPASFARLRQALVAAMGGDMAKAGDLAEDEYDRLSTLYNQVQRQHGGVLERITRIERVLRDFEAFKPDGTAPITSLLVPQPAGATSMPQLQVIDIDKGLDEIDHAHMVDLAFQLLLRRLRSQLITADALIVVGADRIRRAALESMAQDAARNGLQVLLFFEHLREDAVSLIGGGSAAAAFFRLGNHKEAQEASDFIGAGYKWVESQHTRSEGESLTRTWGVEAGSSQTVTENQPMGGSVSQSTSTGSSYSSAFGNSKEYSTSDQRVREAVVDPEVIQGLPLTGMIWIEVRTKGQRIAANVDCNPQITFAPRVSRQPRALPSAG